MARLGERFEAAGIANWMAHRARHYWATSAHRAGMSVFDIATEGGWKDLKMVQRSSATPRPDHSKSSNDSRHHSPAFSAERSANSGTNCGHNAGAANLGASE